MHYSTTHNIFEVRNDKVSAATCIIYGLSAHEIHQLHHKQIEITSPVLGMLLISINDNMWHTQVENKHYSVFNY